MVSAIGQLILGEGHRCPDVGGGGRIGEARRHHANHGVLLAAEHDGAPHCAGVARKAALPQSVTDQDDVRTTGTVFFRPEHAAQCGPRAQHGKEIPGDGCALQSLRFAGLSARVSSQVEDVEAAILRGRSNIFGGSAGADEGEPSQATGA